MVSLMSQRQIALLLVMKLCFVGSLSSASNTFYYSNDEYQAGEYFKVAESVSFNRFTHFANPIETLKNGLEQTVQDLDLLNWVHIKGNPTLPTENYNRTKHYKSWISDQTGETCGNVRAYVLVRDSLTPVTFRESNPCVVESGTWEDPYSHKTLRSAADVDIDHLVPLKNSYISGAWAWSKTKRCQYANFINSEFHLVAASSVENQQKGDKTPAAYLPKRRDNVCTYLKYWLSTKLIWGLNISSAESEGIHRAIESYKCSDEDFEITKSELGRLRSAINQSYDDCR